MSSIWVEKTKQGMAYRMNGELQKQKQSHYLRENLSDKALGIKIQGQAMTEAGGDIIGNCHININLYLRSGRENYNMLICGDVE